MKCTQDWQTKLLYYISLQKQLVVLTIQCLPWLQTSWRDSGYERFALVMRTNCIRQPNRQAAQFLLQPQYICEAIITNDWSIQYIRLVLLCSYKHSHFCYHHCRKWSLVEYSKGHQDETKCIIWSPTFMDKDGRKCIIWSPTFMDKDGRKWSI